MGAQAGWIAGMCGDIEMNLHYMSCADTAKLIRAALKKNFPHVKFSIKSKTYAGGASVRVSWTDGPCTIAVDGVVKCFSAGRFDGMIDLAYSVSHWIMPDGSVTLASDPGTADNGGSNPSTREWMPHPEAKLVRFGADYVFTNRIVTRGLMERAIARLARRGLPVETIEIHVSDYDGGAHVRTLTFDHTATRGWDMEREVYQAVQRTHCARGVNMAEG